MRPTRPLVLTVVTAAAFLLPAATASAHDGNHPFKNCPEAYAHGYSHIPQGDEHYGDHLDGHDNNGWGCEGKTLANDGKAGTGHYAKTSPSPTPTSTATPSRTPSPTETVTASSGEEDLAETGGTSATPYIAAGGLLLAGAGGVLFARRRRTS